MPQSYDVVVIGGGHNGLVNAAYLAKAGKKVVVLERRGVLGQEDVGRRACALLDDLGREHVLVVGANRHLDSGRTLEHGDERRDRLQVLAAVERERRPTALSLAERHHRRDDQQRARNDRNRPAPAHLSISGNPPNRPHLM